MLNVVAALWLASLAHLFVYLTIGFNAHAQEPWFTTRDIAIIIGVDTISAFAVALAASKILLLFNRTLKLLPKLASGLSNIVFISIGVALITAFVQGSGGG